MDKKTIVLVSSHTLVRESWAYVINSYPQYAVIGETDDVQKGIMLAKELCPDVLVIDTGLSGQGIFETIKLVRKYAPKTKILGVFLYSQTAYARSMLQKGASGYVTKRTPLHEFLLAIKMVANGEKYLCSELKNKIMQHRSNLELDARVELLSLREIEVIKHLKQGLSSKEIGHVLSIAVKTVDVHRYNILRKLNCKNVASLVNYINWSPIVES